MGKRQIFFWYFFLYPRRCSARKYMEQKEPSPAEPTISFTEDRSETGRDAFRVLDVGERAYDGGQAIAVLLSEPLDPKIRHDSHLRISDPKKMLRSAWVLSDDHRVLFFPHVEPETEYSVSVLETLRAANGRSLSDRISKIVTTRKIMPAVSFASEGFLLPAKMTDGLPVVAVNVKNVDIEFFRLNENALVHFVNWKNTTGRKSYHKLKGIKKHGEFIFSGRFDLNAPRNKRTTCHIPVENIAALQNPGVYLAVMRVPGEYAYNYQSTYFLVTDIGLHARVYENESLIAASSLSTGAPLSDVRLTFYNKKGISVGEGMTDADGFLPIS